ncbi:MAG: hypothetical protein KDD82_12525 [Planctomycetes bacterium]|nr:hypothetical protein [Planctomycetota bacterium]
MLGIDREEQDSGTIEAAYKEKMRALQSIRSSKDKGFIEFLKEELRTARLTLTKDDRRKAYDESLVADSLQGFKDWVKPLLAMGFVPKSVYDLMLQTGVKEGLDEAQAAKLVKELAAEHGATLQLEESSSDLAALENSGYDDADEDDDLGPASDDGDPMFLDDLDPGTPATEPSPTSRRAPPPKPAGNARGGKIQRGFYQDQGGGERSGAGSSSPWDRGGSAARDRSAWGRRRAGAESAATSPAQSGNRTRKESTQRQRERWQNQGEQRQLSEAQRMFNLGAKLCRVADQVHEQLALYFPPQNGRNSITYQRNGVSYDKVFETEHKTYRDALKKFQAALERAQALGPAGDELKRMSDGNAGLVKTILDEIRQLKLKRLAGMTKGEELRMWQGFISSPRPGRLTKTVSLL